MNFQTEHGEIADSIITAHKNAEVEHAITEMPPGDLMPPRCRDLSIQFQAPTWSEPKVLEIPFVEIYPREDKYQLDARKLRTVIEQWLELQQISTSC